MAKSRLYGWNGEMPEKPLSGQALIVFNGMKSRPEDMKTGHEWTELIGDQLATRQDPYRVVLYYILTLKNRGVIKTNEFDINATTKQGTVKHGIVVRTEATVEERVVIPPQGSEANEIDEGDEDAEGVDDTADEEDDEADEADVDGTTDHA